MANKSRFFTTKKGFNSTRLFLRDREVASTWFDKELKIWCVAFAENNKWGEFKTFAEADYFAWLNFDKAT